MDISKLWNLNPSRMEIETLVTLSFCKTVSSPQSFSSVPMEQHLVLPSSSSQAPGGSFWTDCFLVNLKVSKWMEPAAATADVPLCCYQYRPSSPAQLSAVPCQTGTVLVIIPILFGRESHCSSENIQNHFTKGSASPGHHQPRLSWKFRCFGTACLCWPLAASSLPESPNTLVFVIDFELIKHCFH